MRKAKITFEVDNCLNCPYCEKHQLMTPDSFEHEVGAFCSQTEAISKEWVHETYDGIISKRMIGCDDWHLEQYTKVPDWCPFILQQYMAFLLELDADDGWRSCLLANTSNPWNLPELAFDYGLGHALKTIGYASQFLYDLAENSFKDFLYGEECHSVERDRHLMEIVAMLRHIGKYEPTEGNRKDKLDKLSYVRGSDLSDEDKDIVIDAILHWDESIELVDEFEKMKELAKAHKRIATIDTSTAIKVSLLLGSMLDVGQHRVVKSDYYAKRRPLVRAFQHIEKAEFKFTYNEHYGKVSGPHPKNAAELHYFTFDDFDTNALKAWPELVLVPRAIAKDFLGLKSFKFFVNDKEVNPKRFESST